MATIDNYTIDIKVKGAQDVTATTNSVEKLGGSLKDLNEKFESAKGKAEQFAVAIAGIGLAEYVNKVMESASATKDLSEAYGLTISTVLELQAGFQKAGRGADDMSRMMTVLNQKALEVADGNIATEASFNDLGITFNDLKTMSMDEIMLKIGKAMEEGKGSAKTLAAAMDILGKGAKGVPWGDFVEGLEKSRGKMGDAATATETLDKTMKQLEASAANIKREFTILIAPVAEVFNKFMEGSDNARAAAIALGSALAVISGAIAAKGIMMVVETFKEFAIMTGISSAATLVETSALTANTAATALNAASKSKALAAKVASIEASIAEAQAALRGEATSMTEAAAKAVLERNTWRLVVAKGALAEATVLETGAVSASAAALATEAAAAGTAATATTAFGAAVGFVMKNLGPITIAISAIAAAYQAWDYFATKEEATKAAEKTNDALKDVHETNQSILDDEAKKANLQAAAEVALRNQYQQQDLNLQISQERLRVQLATIGASEIEKTKRLALFDEESKRLTEITKLEGDISRLRTQAANEKEGEKKYGGQIAILEEQLEILKKQKNITTELTVEIKKAEQAEMNRKFGVDIVNKSLDEQLKLEFELANLTKSADDQKITAIQERIQLEARAEIVRREGLLGAGGKLPEEEKLRIIKQLTEAYQPLIEAQKKLTEQSRTFETGWKRAFNTYMDSATNAAIKAENMFNSVTRNMESAIDKFVDTGKFSFGDFATSVIKDLMKIELKAATMNLWKAMSGPSSGGSSGGGILSTVGKWLGFADGGEPPTNKPSIVGENGPEVFIPKNPGTILNQNQLATLGAGAGQQSTPAPVYNITNNISAIDAKSVQQLFAENRRALLGTVRLAEKEMPTRR